MEYTVMAYIVMVGLCSYGRSQLVPAIGVGIVLGEESLDGIVG